MTNAPGMKKQTAAITHRLIEDVPLCPAAAIHRGPRTVAMLNSSTSQKPIVLRNCDMASWAGGAVDVTGSRPRRVLTHPASKNPELAVPLNSRTRPTWGTHRQDHRAKTPPCPRGV